MTLHWRLVSVASNASDAALPDLLGCPADSSGPGDLYGSPACQSCLKGSCALHISGKPSWCYAGQCSSCPMPLMLYQPEQGTPYVACSGAPLCRQTVCFPSATGRADVSPQHCTQCPGNISKLTIK